MTAGKKFSGRSTIAAAALCAALGFGAGRFITGQSSVPGVARSTPAVSQNQGPTTAMNSPGQTADRSLPTLPRPAFTNPEGFRDYVTRLQNETGIPEDFARWLSLLLVARDNFDAAFQIAKTERLISPWSTGAAVLHPDEASKAILSLDPKERDGAFNGLIEALGGIDPVTGLKILQTLPTSVASNGAFPFFERWAASSLLTATDAAMAIPAADLRNRAIAGVFHAWGIVDRRAMLEWATKQDPSVGRAAFRSAYEGVGTRDPGQMLEFMAEYPKLTDWMITAQIGRALAAQGADGWDAIVRLPSGPLRNQLLLRAASDLARTDPVGAWKVFQTLDPKDQNYFLKLSFPELAEAAPAEMAEMARTGRISASYGFRSVMESWAKKNPQDAIAWSNAHLEGTSKNDALRSVFEQWATTDPAAARVAMAGLPPGMRAKLLPDIAQSWAAADPAQALAWAQSCAPVDRTRAIESVVEGWSRKDPLAAAKALLAMPPDGLESAFDTVSRNLARSQPASAAQWAAGLADAKTQNRAIESIAQVWGRGDASAAADYLTAMPAGDFRDHAVGGFVRSIVNLDPATAATWAGSIQTPDLRSSNLKSVLRSWRVKDHAAALAFATNLAPGPLQDEMVKAVWP